MLITTAPSQVAFFAFLNSGQVYIIYLETIDKAVYSKLTQIQICLNLKCIYIYELIYKQFRNALVKYIKNYTLGDGSQQGISYGPLQNSMQYERVKSFFDDIENQGWKVATGGKVEASSGYFMSPTIIDRPPEKSRIVVEEPFGKQECLQEEIMKSPTIDSKTINTSFNST